MKELGTLVGLLVVLWILWVLTGGPARVENANRPFITAPQPIQSGSIYTYNEVRKGER